MASTDKSSSSGMPRAATTCYGAAAFCLQSVGNIVIMVVLLLLPTAVGGTRLRRRFAEKPSRSTALVAVSFLVAGVFTVLYRDVRLLARREPIWYPVAPWG